MSIQSFRRCMIDAVATKALEQHEADDLMRRYEAHVEAAKGTDRPGGPEAVARETLAMDILDQAARKRRLAELAAEKTDEILHYLTTYRDLATGKPDVRRAAMALIENRNRELAGIVSVVDAREGYISRAHGNLEASLYEFRRKHVTGIRKNVASYENIVKEAYGEAHDDTLARGFFRGWLEQADWLIDRFNELGGTVKKLANYLPQSHDARKLAKAGVEAWRDFIKARLHPSHFEGPDALTDEALKHSFDRIETDGAVDMKPSSQKMGRGALASQRQEERFFRFKDAAAHMEYAHAFGDPDVFASMMNHIHGLAKDVAALKVLGPNPSAMVEWMIQVASKEEALAKVGDESLHRARAIGTTADIGRLWNVVNGSIDVKNPAAADLVDTARNVVTSVNLASAAVGAAAGDPVTGMLASHFSGVSSLRWLAGLPRMIFSGAARREVVRAGIIMESAMEHMRTDFSRLGRIAGSRELSRYLPDRVFAWTGLTPFDNVKRLDSAWNVMFHAGELADKSLAEIARGSLNDQRFARWLGGFGIDEATWDKIRTSGQTEMGEAGRILKPIHVMKAGHEDAFLRYTAAINAFVEEASPRGTARASIVLGRDGPRGDLKTEGWREATSYMTYGTTTLMSLKRAVALEMAAGGLGRGIGFIAPAICALTLAGAMTMQIKSMLRGQDPENMTSANFWARALLRGGAFGFYGDVLMADYERGAADVAAQFAGPLPGTGLDLLAAVDPFGVTKSKFNTNKDINRAARLVQFARSNTPVANMWWLKPVTERLIWDRLQLLADPKAAANWQRKANQLFKEQGQGTFWRRGQALPDRPPDFGHLW